MVTTVSPTAAGISQGDYTNRSSRLVAGIRIDFVMTAVARSGECMKFSKIEFLRGCSCWPVFLAGATLALKAAGLSFGSQGDICTGMPALITLAVCATGPLVKIGGVAVGRA